MRRSLSVRIAALVFVTFMATAPAFAAPRRDDTPLGDLDTTISRIFRQVIEVLELISATVPK
jgi:hypothetical protein